MCTLGVASDLRDAVVAVVNVIKGLEPRPGRQYSEEEPQYITPDIHVYKSEGEFIIVLNDDGMPKLRIEESATKRQARIALIRAQEGLRDANRLVDDLEAELDGDFPDRQIAISEAELAVADLESTLADLDDQRQSATLVAPADAIVSANSNIISQLTAEDLQVLLS